MIAFFSRPFQTCSSERTGSTPGGLTGRVQAKEDILESIKDRLDSFKTESKGERREKLMFGEERRREEESLLVELL